MTDIHALRESILGDIHKPLTVKNIENVLRGKKRLNRQYVGVDLAKQLDFNLAKKEDTNLPLWICLNSNDFTPQERNKYHTQLGKEGHNIEAIRSISDILNWGKIPWTFSDEIILYEKLRTSHGEYTNCLLKNSVSSRYFFYECTDAEDACAQIDIMNKLGKFKCESAIDEVYGICLVNGDYENVGGIRLCLEYSDDIVTAENWLCSQNISDIITSVGGYFKKHSVINQIQGAKGKGKYIDKFYRKFQIAPSDLLVLLFYSLSQQQTVLLNKKPQQTTDTHFCGNKKPYAHVAERLHLRDSADRYRFVVTQDAFKNISAPAKELHDRVMSDFDAFKIQN